MPGRPVHARATSPSFFGHGHCVHAGMVLVLAALLIASAGAAEPPSPAINYRNDGSGVFPDAKPPPRWNATTTAPANVLWHTPLPGPAETSQPVIGGGCIYVQSVPFTITCIDKMTGKIVWQRERHAIQDAAAGSEEEKAFRLERYVEYCERKIIARFGSMKPTPPGRPLSVEERYQDAIWFRSPRPQKDEDTGGLEREYAEVTQGIPKTWLGSNAHVALADNYGYKNYTGIASPTTDGQSVFAHFATGVVVAYDRGGTRRWIRLLTTPDGNLPGPRQSAAPYQAVTPLLHDGRLYLQRLTGGNPKNLKEADLYCLDAATGATVWVKPMGAGGYTGPLAVARNGAWYIATADGAIFRPDGTRLAEKPWTYFQAGGNAGPSPAIDRQTGTVYLSAGVRLPNAGENKPTVLWSLLRSGKGAPSGADAWLAQHVPAGEKPARRSETEVWQRRAEEAPRGQQNKRGGVRNFSSPVVHRGVFYFVNSAFKVLSASDVSKDVLEEMYYAEPLPFAEVRGKPRGSQVEVPFLYTDLTIAGDYLFVHGWTETVIVKAGKEFGVAGVCPHEPGMTNLVFDGERMYLRSLQHLWCLSDMRAGN